MTHVSVFRRSAVPGGCDGAGADVAVRDLRLHLDGGPQEGLAQEEGDQVRENMSYERRISFLISAFHRGACLISLTATSCNAMYRAGLKSGP